ncbi:Tetratricopeptide repeat (TPR)-like superfamily protein [Hibiscus syriacus]|uniref:Tetratricopeptide repeat (TPR)-like superfamily protein n=1 Tax=Hibiscus syriacus TaxID=106335 RepID=A0A6A3ALZ8_HIBSY|nr:Tetratricopeptide repeat (TPR)-like superfamily protein [Hibiscus syriacus]
MVNQGRDVCGPNQGFGNKRSQERISRRHRRVSGRRHGRKDSYPRRSLAEIFEMDSRNKERREAVVDIQLSLERLHMVFLDMAVLVEAQGETMADIEENVAHAGDFISGVTNQLYYPNQMKRKKTACV